MKEVQVLKTESSSSKPGDTKIEDNSITTKIVDIPIPEPGEGQVLIKVIVSGTNPKDWKM